MGLRRGREFMLLLKSMAVAAITVLQRYEFTDDAAAPLGTPYTEGLGSLTLVQTDGQFSKSGGALVFPAQTTPVDGDQGFYGDVVTRVAGVALVAAIKRTSGNYITIGWGTSTSLQIGSFANTEGGIASSNNQTTMLLPSGSVTSIVTGDAWTNNTEYGIAIVLRTAGLFVFRKATNWQLLWVYGNGNSATLRPMFSNYDAAGNFTHFRVRKLTAPFDTDYGLATLHVAAPVSSTEYTGNADGLTYLTVTAPAALDGADTTRCGFYYRTDADLTPSWDCYVDGLGRGRVDSIAADGTRTNRASITSVIAANATIKLLNVHAGALHEMYTESALGVWTKRGAQINVSLNDTVTTIEPHVPAGWSAANLDDYPRTLSAENGAILDAT